MSNLSELEGIFLDFYGTIAAGDRAAVESACARVVADFGLSLSAAELAGRWGHVFFEAIERHNDADFKTLADLERDTLAETLRPLVGHADPTPYVAEICAYWRNPPLYPEAKKAIADCPVPICCVSNVDTEDLESACELHGLHFDFIVTSEAARSYKPHEAIFRMALDRTGWSPERIIHVGDSLHSDVEGAHGVGIRAAWLHREDRILDIGKADPDWTWPDLSNLSDHLFL